MSADGHDVERVRRMFKVWAAAKGWRLGSSLPVPQARGMWLVAVKKGYGNQESLVRVSNADIVKAQS